MQPRIPRSKPEAPGTKISDIEFYLVAGPSTEPPHRVRSLVVRVVCDTGLEGWGEAPLEWRANELEARRHALLPIVAGRNLFDVEELLTLEALKPASLKAALEMASWDAIGRAVGEPICHLWGGVYRARIPLAARLLGESVEAATLRARELAERGFHTQVIGGTGSVEQDVARVFAIGEALGERVELRFDAGARYSLDDAVELCRRLEKIETLRYVVDPLASNELESVAKLRRQTTLSLALARSLGATSSLFQVARVQAASAAIVSLDRSGGMLAARKCGSVAESAGMSISLAERSSLGLGLAAILQIVACTPAFGAANECCYYDLRDDILAERLEIVDGLIAVPEGPGLGVEVDRGKLERYLVA